MIKSHIERAPDPALTGIAAVLALSALILLAACAAQAEPAAADPLAFDSSAYTLKTATVNGKSFQYRAYEKIMPVTHPVDRDYESLNIYIPVEYFEGKSSGAYTAETAPIFLPNSVGGYMPGAAGSPGRNMMSGGDNAALVALSKGIVVAEPGARGRTNKGADGSFTGKAPAAIVDLKAAVRYLRHNDRLMPGSAERIISDGTSAGGALSALLGASGNSADYEPYLKALGAAEERDDIYAVMAYCPITNLENADAAYEWLFAGVNNYSRMVFEAPPDAAGGAQNAGPNGTMTPGGPGTRTVQTGTMSAEQIKNSAALAALFPAYLNSLGLRDASGAALSLDAEGNGSFKELVKSYIEASAQKALDSGQLSAGDASKLGWLKLENSRVADMDLAAYAAAATRMKTAPAFDGTDLGNGENDEFGTAAVQAQHFTAFGAEHSTVKAGSADPHIVKMMNAMLYIGAPGSVSSKFWRIRHGTADRDTSLAVPVMLATKAANTGFSVDFAMPWNVPHSGDYDLDELFAWIEKICR